jgi:hypothetical protein
VASALIRCGLLALAIVAGAWLVVGYRAVELEADATTVTPAGERVEISSDESNHALTSLRRARLLSMDKAPLLSEGLLLFATGHREEGLTLVERVVSEEPDNLDGWIRLHFLYLANHDRQGAARAARRVRELNPLAGDALRG